MEFGNALAARIRLRNLAFSNERFSNIRQRGVKQFVQCPLCPYNTSARGRFRDHMLTHTGERPHPCPHCGRRFTQKSTMRRHAAKHCI